MSILILFLLITPINLLFFGLANRNIAAKAGKNISKAFWIGVIGPLSTIILLFQSVKVTGYKILAGFGRFLILSITIGLLVELNIINKPGLTYSLLVYYGILFTLRGKYLFNYTIKNITNDSESQ